jgi:hypothetical protein
LDTTINISMTTDNDGYVLVQCEHCGTFFKLKPKDMEDEGVLEIYCPSCGLISENYLTEDVLKLAGTKIENYAMDLLYDNLKTIERKTKNSAVSFNAGKRPKHKYENPIRSGIDAMEVANFGCCKRTAKVKALLKFAGCYCPFCGVMDYEVK